MRALILFSLSLVFAAAATLTLRPAPTLALWRLAILVGEFGVWLIPLPVAVAVVAAAHGGRLCWATVAFSALAAAGFLWPLVAAKRIAAPLEQALTSAFGPAAVGRAPFAFSSLIGRTKAVTPRTFQIKSASGEDLPMDFYEAENANASSPCVIVVHGGGWDNGSREDLPDLNFHLAQRGYAVAAVSYRLAPEHPWPAQADDIGRALAWLKSHADELGIDANCFFVLGRSAGGQLATAFAFGNPDPAIRGVVSLYGPQDQVFAWQFSRDDDLLNATKLLRQFLGGTPDTAPTNYRGASPYLFATRENARPMLMIHGRRDALVWHKQSERMHAKLESLGVPNVFVSLPWATHACDFTLHGPSGQLTTYAIDWFLDTHWGPRR